MKVGCFAVMDPFSPVDCQLEHVADMGFKYADVTANYPGSTHGFTVSASLGQNPQDVLDLFHKYGLSPTSVYAHANLLDPSSPARYSTAEIMKAIQLAAGLGVRDVITTDGEPSSNWSRRLSYDEKVFIVAEKLFEPIRLAEHFGIRLLLEPCGELTDTIEGIEAIFDRLGNPANLGLNLDTGNIWLGGDDPLEMAETFRDQIYHVHWKDLPADWERQRCAMFGCGLGPIALGEGVIDIEGIFGVLKGGPAEYSTIEVCGEENILESYSYLKTLGIE